MTFKEKYINPFTDFGFKKLFGTEPNKDLLINFLNEVILPQQKKVADLSYRRNEHIRHTEMDRKAIFDLYCVSPSGERFIVEMQKAKQNYFKDRSVFYSTFPIQEQAQAGDWNYRLSAVYTVGILDFTFNDDDSKGNSIKEVRHEVQLKNQKGDVFYDKLTFVYLEMPHFNKSEDELETAYDKWLFVLKHLPNLTERPQKLQDRIFQRLFEAAEIAKFSHEEKEQYEESLKSYRDLKNVIDTAFDEGEAKGKEERATEIASNMLKKGLPIDLVGEITELPLELIARLKENLL